MNSKLRWQIERDQHANGDISLHLFIAGRERASARLYARRQARGDADAVVVAWDESERAGVMPEWALVFSEGVSELARRIRTEADSTEIGSASAQSSRSRYRR